MQKLNELNLGPTYAPVRQLYALLQDYVREGQRIAVNIPMPDFDRRIKGVLATNRREQVSIALVHGA